MPRPQKSTIDALVDAYADMPWEDQERLLHVLHAIHRQKDRQERREKRAANSAPEPKPETGTLELREPGGNTQ